MPIRLLKHFKVKRANVHIDDINGLILCDDQTEATIMLKRMPQAQEWLKNGDIVCPYFDFDYYVETSVDVDKTFTFAQTAIPFAIKSIMFSICGDLDVEFNEPNIILGSRKPRQVNNKIKISIRAIIDNYKVNYVAFGKMLQDMVKDGKFGFNAFNGDVGIYSSSEQLINCYGSIKSEEVPIPIEYKQYLSEENILYYDKLVPLIQCPRDDAIFLNIPIKEHHNRTLTINTDSNTDIEEYQKLIGMLGDHRYKYDSWLKIGMIGWYTFDGSDDALEVWAEWGSKATNSGDGYKESIRKWDSFRNTNNPITIASLHMWAKEDNKQEYEKLFGSVEVQKVEFIEESDDDKDDDTSSILTEHVIEKDEINKLYLPHISTESSYYIGDYNEVKSLYEKRNFKINNPVSYVEQFDTELILRTKGAFLDRCATIYNDSEEFDKHGKPLKDKFIPRWSVDPYQRVYHRIDFIPPPDQCPHDVFNLWRGYDVSTYESTRDCTRELNEILDYIKKVVCDDKENAYDYIMNWVANIFQQPANKSQIALCLIGNQGDGKTYFTELIANMIGENMSYQTQNAQEYFERFDGTAKLNKMLCVFNEINFEQMGKNAEVLKGYITDTTIRHEKKGIDPITVKLFARYVFTTNNDLPLKIEDGDRRFVALRVSSCYNGENHYEYWGRMQKYKTNKHVLRKLYEHLMNNVEIPHNYNWKKNRPISDDYLAMRKRTISPIYMYLSSICNGADRKFTTTEFTSQFNTFLAQHNFSNTSYNPVTVGRELNTVIRKLNSNGIKRIRVRGKDHIEVEVCHLKDSLTTKDYFFNEFENSEE